MKLNVCGGRQLSMGAYLPALLKHLADQSEERAAQLGRTNGHLQKTPEPTKTMWDLFQDMLPVTLELCSFTTSAKQKEWDAMVLAVATARTSDNDPIGLQLLDCLHRKVPSLRLSVIAP